MNWENWWLWPNKNNLYSYMNIVRINTFPLKPIVGDKLPSALKFLQFWHFWKIIERKCLRKHHKKKMLTQSSQHSGLWVKRFFRCAKRPEHAEESFWPGPYDYSQGSSQLSYKYFTTMSKFTKILKQTTTGRLQTVCAGENVLTLWGLTAAVNIRVSAISAFPI